MTKRKGFTREDYARMAELRERGWSFERIGRKFGCKAATASWHCLRLGAEPPKPPKLWPDRYLKHPVMKRGNHVVRAFTPEEDAQITALAAAGLGNTEIGRRIGRRPNSVLGRLMTIARRDERALRGAA